jgi:hypothetical protein
MKYLKVFENFYSEIDPYGEEEWDDNPICYLIFRHQLSFSFRKYFFIGEFFRDKSLLALDNDQNGNILDFRSRIRLNDTPYLDPIIQRLVLNNKMINNIENGKDFINCVSYHKFDYTLEQIGQHLRQDIPIVYLTRDNMDIYGGQKYRTTSDSGPH